VIHICTNGRCPPEAWLERAQYAVDTLRAEPDAGRRAALLKRYRALWGDLKPWLFELSNGKCWYSEAKDVGSFRDVDHFRPKGRVVRADGSEGEGYWWLAVDWKNFRVSCDVCNKLNRGKDGTRGKADHFPLKDENCRATSEGDDLTLEEPYLLDPTIANEALLVSFEQTGRPLPTKPSGWEAERASETIRILHLDQPRFDDVRKQIWNRCRRNIDRVLRHAAQGAGDPDFDDAVEELREMISGEAEFAGAARTCLSKSGHSWADELVAAASTCSCA
jgi:hypothetical protein